MVNLWALLYSMNENIYILYIEDLLVKYKRTKKYSQNHHQQASVTSFEWKAYVLRYLFTPCGVISSPLIVPKIDFISTLRHFFLTWSKGWDGIQHFFRFCLMNIGFTIILHHVERTPILKKFINAKIFRRIFI